MSSFVVLLVHEIHSFNKMVAAMREGFLTCLQAMRGTQVMSQYVENLVACISSNILMQEIKVNFLKTSFPCTVLLNNLVFLLNQIIIKFISKMQPFNLLPLQSFFW
jgi:hypothetical protein